MPGTAATALHFAALRPMRFPVGSVRLPPRPRGAAPVTFRMQANDGRLMPPWIEPGDDEDLRVEAEREVRQICMCVGTGWLPAMGLGWV